MYVNIETTDNGFIVRVTPNGQFEKTEVRVYTKFSDVMKWLKQLLEPEPESK